MVDEDAGIGPVSYLIVEFPGSKMTGEGLPILVDLVDAGIIRVLDLLFVTKGEDGTLTGAVIADLDQDGDLDLAVFDGATSGLLDQSDLDDAAEVLEPGSSAAILLFENTWARDFTQALRNGGAEVVAAGYVPLDALAASLDAAEAGA
jgi:hypothetical protein